MTKYEFKVLLDAPIVRLESMLADLGSQGYQVVGYNELNNTTARVILQRPAQLGALGKLGG